MSQRTEALLITAAPEEIERIRQVLAGSKAQCQPLASLDALERSDNQIVQAGRLASLGQLVPIIAHEINNPLALITNNLYLLERDVTALRELVRLYQEADTNLAATQPDLAERLRTHGENIDLTYTLANPAKLLERARNGLHRIQQMVRDLVDFGRPGEGLAHNVDINAGIEATLRLLQRRAEKQRVSLQSELGSLPPLTCCPGAVNQVVLNLVLNGIEACLDGGSVTVRSCLSSEAVEIHIADTGSGIDPAVRDRMFEPFVTTKAGAQGLGLCIAKGLLAEQGGHLDVDSAVGGGALFIVHLPVRL
jgi:signal transduction histidine kinase